MDERHETAPKPPTAPHHAPECSTCSLILRLSLTFLLGLVVMAAVAVSARVLPGDSAIWSAMPFAQEFGHRAAVFVPYAVVPFLAIGLMAALVNYWLGSHGGFQWWGEFAGLGAAAVSVVWSLQVVFNRTYTAGENCDVSGSFIVQVLVICLLASVVGGQVGRTVAERHGRI